MMPCIAQVTSMKDMRDGAPGRPPIAPNIEMTVRDKPHASRRLLSRPWACDPVISELLDAMLLGSNSILQNIEHSVHLQAMCVYTICVSWLGHTKLRRAMLSVCKLGRA